MVGTSGDTGFKGTQWLLCRWFMGAKASDGFTYSLIETTKLNGVNPLAWLTVVLTLIADHPINKIE